MTLQTLRPDIELPEVDPLGDLLDHTIGEVIDTDHHIALGEEAVREVATDETCDTGDHDWSSTLCLHQRVYAALEASSKNIWTVSLENSSRSLPLSESFL